MREKDEPKRLVDSVIKSLEGRRMRLGAQLGKSLIMNWDEEAKKTIVLLPSAKTLLEAGTGFSTRIERLCKLDTRKEKDIKRSPQRGGVLIRPLGERDIEVYYRIVDQRRGRIKINKIHIIAGTEASSIRNTHGSSFWKLRGRKSEEGRKEKIPEKRA